MTFVCNFDVCNHRIGSGRMSVEFDSFRDRLRSEFFSERRINKFFVAGRFLLRGSIHRDPSPPPHHRGRLLDHDPRTPGGTDRVAPRRERDRRRRLLARGKRDAIWPSPA
jgi:hypothetical protein